MDTEDYSLVWTAVPKFKTEDGDHATLRLSAVVTLLGTGSSAESREAVRKTFFDWPRLLSQRLQGFVVELRDERGRSPERLTARVVGEARPDSELWRRMFRHDGDLLVGKHEIAKPVPVRTYPRGKITKSLDDLYDEVARIYALAPSAKDLHRELLMRVAPTLEQLQWRRETRSGKPREDTVGVTDGPLRFAAPRPPYESELEQADRLAERDLHRLDDRPHDRLLSEVIEEIKRMDRRIETDGCLRAELAKEEDEVSASRRRFLQLATFHGRVSRRDHDPVKSGEIPSPPDFPQQLAMARDHPALAPWLGLVFDLECSPVRRDVLARLDRVEVKPDWTTPPDLPTAPSPRTRYSVWRLSSRAFRPRDRDDGIWKGGMLDTGGVTEAGPRFELLQTDTDGTVLKLLNQAENLAQAGRGAMWMSDSSGQLLKKSRQPVATPAARKKLGLPNRLLERTLVEPDLFDVVRVDDRDARNGFSTLLERLQDRTSARVTLRLLSGAVESGWVTPLLRDGSGKIDALFWEINNEPTSAPTDERDLRLPGRRSTGVSLVWNDRGVDLVHERARAKRLFLENPPVLDSADLTLGYVVDVEVGDETHEPRWFPLCQRVERYFAEDGTSDPIFESEGVVEGPMRVGLTRATDATELQRHDKAPGPVDDKLAESLFTWDGWSLSVPSFTPHWEHPGPGTIPPAPTTWETGLRAGHQVAPKTLPPLRYGTEIRGRVRAFLIDNQCLPFEEVPDRAPATEKVPYLRQHAVPPPVLLLTSSVDSNATPGRSVTTLVVRDDGPDQDQRRIAPPRSPFWDVERHGMFDGKRFGSLNRGFLDAQLEPDGSFPTVPDPKLQREQERQHARETKVETANSPIWRRYDRSIGPPKKAYYPDPCSRGVQLVGRFADGRRHSASLSFYTSQRQRWPRATTTTLEVVKGNDEEAVFSYVGRRGLRISLPPGWAGELELSSSPGSENLGLFGAWASTEPLFRGERRAHARVIAASGLNPTISSTRIVQVVHAVQKPLGSVQIREVTVDVDCLVPGRKKFACTECDTEGGVKGYPVDKSTRELSISISFDPKSTGKLVVFAKWVRWVDRAESPGRTKVTEEQVVGEVQLGGPSSMFGEVRSFPLSHEIGTPSYRSVDYSVTAVSRFRNYYPDLSEDDASVESQPLRVEVLNTRRPAPPNFEYCVPFFDWETGIREPYNGPHSHAHSRYGGGLRVYLTRGWYDSGDGEQLALVLRDERKSGTNLPSSMHGVVTRWGSDPIHSDAFPVQGASGERPPNLRDVRYSNAERRGEHLLESPEPVDLACFDPQWDPDKGLWYADVRIVPPAYNVFVRLALCRFQPNTVRCSGDDGERLSPAALSPVVLADFAQLGPDRTVTIRPNKLKERTLHLELHGHGPKWSNRPEDQNRIEIRVLRRCGDRGASKLDEMGWVLDPDATVAPVKPIFGFYAAEVQIPGPRTERRIALLEFEEYEAQPDSRASEAGPPVPTRRLVYTDVLDL